MGLKVRGFGPAFPMLWDNLSKDREGWYTNMIILKVSDAEYKVKFGYKALAQAKVLPKVISLFKEREAMVEKQSKVLPEFEDEYDFGMDHVKLLDRIIVLTGELLLAGLQRYHKDDFGCDFTDCDSISQAMDSVGNFIDDYMDENEDTSIEDLFELLTDDLFNSGFLSRKSEETEETTETVKETKAKK